jgi:UDP-N-acetylmuramoyl-tripeptide--D-alanyl-D-alanine ligase
MEDLTLYEIVKAVEGSYGYPSTEIISSVSTDTRKITKGCVFIALRGDKFDGHDFVKQAIELGAVAAITEKPVEGVKCIIVDNTKKALADLARYYRSRFNPILVGVTGSVGKTTTKEMIALVLSGKYLTLKTEGNFNNEIGLPHTLLNLTSEHEAAVIEMGMSDFGEISMLSQISRPSIAVITNIGYSHIENLGSREGILKAKLEIIDGTSHDAPLILNGDDDMLANLKDEVNRDIVFYGINNPNVDVRATDIEIKDGVTTFVITYWGKTISAKLNCVGMHNVLNALAAFSVGIMAEIEPEKIVEKLAEFIPSGLRQSIVKKGEQTVIIDCYNAAPDSMKASLAILSELSPMPGGRRIAVLGDMLELGSMSQKLHEQVGEYVFNSKTDILVCYGNDSKYIAEKAKELGLLNSRFFSDKSETVSYLKEIIKKNDLLLFKASRGIKLEEVIEEIYK